MYTQLSTLYKFCVIRFHVLRAYLQTDQERRQGWGMGAKSPSQKNGGILTLPSIQGRNSLICTFRKKKVKTLQKFSLKLAQVLHQITSRDPQIFKTLSTGREHPLLLDYSPRNAVLEQRSPLPHRSREQLPTTMIEIDVCRLQTDYTGNVLNVVRLLDLKLPRTAYRWVYPTFATAI